MGRKSKWEHKAIYQRYYQVKRTLRGRSLDAFCQICGYHRKYAVRLLDSDNGPSSSITTSVTAKA